MFGIGIRDAEILALRPDATPVYLVFVGCAPVVGGWHLQLRRKLFWHD
jgi:hypothetical protein